MRIREKDLKDLDAPANLSADGKLAWAIINQMLMRMDTMFTGGCKAYYSPEEWAKRGEEYGKDSVLVICHDGGDLANYFNWDYCDYAAVEQMRQWLGEHGFMAEQCTTWYSAIYKNGRKA